ncbi:toll/interleukin-1 receptor domain-containing protein [Mycolicibacterium rhodesiae]|uniref:TIR domain-containing protein n=1 Tax=Mycolicibacterium rhodesiae TaxID=36814 RepID=A0A1X0J5J4_MYCRH|nr:toll/interleukin-1 receptor domain-containing protein [Mycolicibacterium rhodesiae]MCV7348266.1 toll/interleukin-1 receptor domain-containing protein [Mycolicibacterium rhodesiae]ORB57393.1 hypothetical protein BST42_03185 [Mycolicibacterium rhodesiae]
MAANDFRIFISWSGPLAKNVASALHGWLPEMFDNIDPWFSESDIPAGETWFGEIQKRLDTSDYGIIVVTTENVEKPWLNFEAGSLSKRLGEDRARVTPILANFDQLTQLTGHPLAQYNAVLLNEAGIGRLCESIALSAGRNLTSVRSRYSRLWGELESKIAGAKAVAGQQPPPPEVSEPQQLQALTESVRALELAIARFTRGTPALRDKLLKSVSNRVQAIVGTEFDSYVLSHDDELTLIRLDFAAHEPAPEEIDEIIDIYSAQFGTPVSLYTFSWDGQREHKRR